MIFIHVHKKLLGMVLIFCIVLFSSGTLCVTAQQVNARGSEIKQEVLDMVLNLPDSTIPIEKPIGLYYTLSNSGEGTALHFQIPIIIRLLDPTGINFLALVYYTSPDANTTVVNNRGDIIFDVHGKHAMFLHGFGIISFNGSLFNSRLLLAGLSVFPPVIIQ